MNSGAITCLGCKQTYYPGRTALTHRDCQPVWKIPLVVNKPEVVVNTKPLVVNMVANTPQVVVNKPEGLVVNRSLDRHNKERRREYMRNYMSARRSKKNSSLHAA